MTSGSLKRGIHLVKEECLCDTVSRIDLEGSRYQYRVLERIVWAFVDRGLYQSENRSPHLTLGLVKDAATNSVEGGT